MFGGNAVAGGVRTEPDAMAEDVLRQLLHVLRIDFRALVHEERPHFHEPPPADRRARRRPEVHVVLDHLRRRPMVPICFVVVWARRADKTPDVLSELLVQEYLAGDDASEVDDALLRHERV